MDDRTLLFHLAEDAFDVLNWARREGFKRDKQLEQVVEAFQKTLADNKTTLCVVNEGDGLAVHSNGE